jgi:hypothetical protein
MDPFKNPNAWQFYVGIAVLVGITFFIFLGLQAWRDNRFVCGRRR